MNKFDPRLFAVGTGAVLGANLLSTDNDPLAIASGLAIGGGAGALMNLSMPSNLDQSGHKAINNVRSVLDPSSTTGRVRTFEELRRDVISLGAAIAKKDLNSASAFSRDTPYGTLNKNTFEDFNRYLSNLTSEESLKQLHLALKSKSDDIFLNGSSIDKTLATDVKAVTKIKEGANLKSKRDALTSELKKLGYSGQDLDEKLLKFEPLLKSHTDAIHISDGVIDLKGLGKVQLTHTIGTGAESAIVHSNNRNMYDVKRVNVFGSLLADTNGLADKDSVAVAKAIGLQMADLFNLNAQFNAVQGMAPDDAIAMMAHTGKLNPEQMSKFIENMNSNYSYNESMSGQNKAYILGQGAAVTKPSSNSMRISNSVSYGTTLNFDQQGELVEGNPFRGLGLVSKTGTEQSEVKRLHTELSKRAGEVFYGTSADHATDLPVTGSATNKVFSINGPIERNIGTVYNRDISSTLDTSLNRSVSAILEQYQGKHQFASAVAMQAYSVNPDLEIPGTKGMTVSDMVSQIFGSDKATGDGYGVANRAITNRVTTEGMTNAILTKTSTGDFIAINPAMRKHLEGQLTIDEMKKQALVGSTELSGGVESSLLKAKDRLERLQVAAVNRNEADIFDFLKQEHRSFGKYNSYTDYLKSNKSLRNASDKFDYMMGIASKTILDRRLTAESLYSRKRQDQSHYKVLDEFKTIDKRLTKIKAAVSTRNFSDATTVINELLDHNEIARSFRDSFEAIFPRPGTTVGYSNDFTPVDIKENYRYLEFDGAIRTLNKSQDDVQEAIQLMYKGVNKAGKEDRSKSYGTSSKLQLKHLEEEEFKRIGFLYSLAKDGNIRMNNGAFEVYLANSNKPVVLGEKAFRSENFMEALAKAGATRADIKVAKNKLSFFSNVGTISDDGGSGMKNATAILDNLKGLSSGDASAEAELRNRLGSSTIADSLISRVKNNTLSENQLKGLSNFAISFSNDRAATDYLLTTVASLRANSDLKVSNYTNAIGTSNEANQLKALQSFAVDVLGDNSFGQGSFDLGRFNAAFQNQERLLMEYNQSPERLVQLLSDDKALGRLSEVFMAERTYRSDTLGDSIIQMSAWNRRTEFETGAGKEGKRMSWNSQTQLKMNGLTDSDLDLFGKFNIKNYADLSAVASMRLEHVATINSQLNESNLKGFQAALREGIAKRRDALTAAGVNVEGVHGVYELGYKNKLGIKNLPIMLEDTALFGNYTDKDGNIIDRKLNNIISQVIDDDLKLKDNSLLKSQREAIQERVNNNIEHIANTIKGSLGGQDNILKKGLARDATHSRYSTMVPVAGQLDKMAKEGQSVVSVSSEGLLKRFQQLGFDYKSMEDIEKGGHLTREGSLHKVYVDKANNVPLYGIINREPAIGPGSARFVEYYLDKSLTNDSKTLNIGGNDRLYKYFQFGDFDLDHTLEYMPDYKSSNYDPIVFKNLLQKGKSINDQLMSSLEYAKLLGVKGSNKDKVGSMLELFEQNGAKYKNTTEWYDDYINNVLISKQKAGDRKTVSPTVTKLAADINNALAGSGAEDGATMRARVLSHYFVENLLKSQHISNENYKKNPVSTAETLAKLLDQSSDKSRFNQEFANYIEDTVISNIKKAGGPQEKQLIEQTLEAVKLIQTSISSYDPSKGPITPMHLPNVKDSSRVPGAIDNLIKAVIGKAANVSIMGVSEELVSEGNDLSLAQRGKLGYHKALEILKHNLGNNKKLLATTAGLTVGAALLTQKKPEFGDSRAEANPSGMLMAPSKSILEDTANQHASQGSLNRAVEYIRPYKKDNSYVGIQATPTGDSNNLSQDVDHFIFGDGLSSARVINSLSNN